MHINERIKKAALLGVKMKRVASMSEVSYYRISSVVNPEKYSSNPKFDRFEEVRINEALDTIKNGF